MITTKSQIHPIMIGTFGLGADRSEAGINSCKTSIVNKNAHLEALLTSFEAGQNYIETSFMYATGETMKFLAEFFRPVFQNISTLKSNVI